MRKKETQPISEILKQFTKESKYEKQLLEMKLVSNWTKVLGPGITSSTRRIYINNRTLFVFIESSVIRNELFMIRTQLQKALNDSVGCEVIDNIIFR